MNPPVLSSFGLIAWLENNRITLPLKGVEASFDVRGDLVSVELCQIYHQDRNQPLDVLYTFPLPAGAAVYRCEMVVNDRVIAAKVMAVEQAHGAASCVRSPTSPFPNPCSIFLSNGRCSIPPGSWSG